MWKRERKLNYREQLILKINEWRKEGRDFFCGKPILKCSYCQVFKLSIAHSTAVEEKKS